MTLLAAAKISPVLAGIKTDVFPMTELLVALPFQQSVQPEIYQLC